MKVWRCIVSVGCHGVSLPTNTSPVSAVGTSLREPDEYRLAPHDTLPYDWTRKDG